MKRNIFRILFSLSLLLTSMGCNGELEVTPPGEFDSGVLLNEAGLRSLLFSAYQFENQNSSAAQIFMVNEVCTDMMVNSGGGENRTIQLFTDFTWDPSVAWIYGLLWQPKYRVIRDANFVIENVGNLDIAESEKNGYTAEARYLRASAYAQLYSYFGTVPLRITTDLSAQGANLPRATDEEMLQFIESELMASASELPNPGTEENYGRATKGHALGILTKFLLNTKQWDKVVQVSEDLMALGYYELYPTYREIFFVENERNKEMIVVWSCLSIDNGTGFWYPNGAYPPGFSRSAKIPEFEWSTSMKNFATQYRITDDFALTYDPNDARFGVIVEEYLNRGGEIVDLTVNVDDRRCFKYFDNAQESNSVGNDIPILRYADILLSRAEALNELNGPTQESLGLVNQVRNRSDMIDLTLAEATDKNTFRDLILDERGWEFLTEHKRREDLIRHGKFVESAIERGKSAKSFHVLFPIPENEVNANPSVVQNDGY